MPNKLSFSLGLLGLASIVLLLGVAARVHGAQPGATISVGRENADVIGDDNVAIQKAIDRIAAQGGGTVLIKAGTYTLQNSVRLVSHLTLRGEGSEKTILKKAAGLRTALKLDADYGELQATVADARGFRPGMGVTIVDKQQRSGWTPSVRTITRVEGSTLFFDRFLHMDYSVENAGEVFNTFPVLAGFDVEDVRVEDLTADGSRVDSQMLDGCQTAAIYFFHSKKMTIRNCVARNYPGDGISTQFVEDPVIESCEAYQNAGLGIHLGTGARRGIVRKNRAHENGEDGLYLCWRVQHGRFEENESWSNGRDGISVGHKDTDNIFVKNTIRENGRWGVYLRDEPEINAGHRNTFRENLVENNGGPDQPGYGFRITGATHNITLISNTIRETRAGSQATQQVGIYVGPQADYVTCEHNTISGNLKSAMVDESKNGHNKLGQAGGK